MNYIGSKFSLLSEIGSMIDRHSPLSGDFCDIFSGTTVVGQMAKKRGYSVISNDIQYYSYIYQRALIGANQYPTFDVLRIEVKEIDNALERTNRPGFGLGNIPSSEARYLNKVLGYLESLEPTSGKFYEEYCEGGEAGRSYFTADNGMRCQSIRDKIAEWHNNSLLNDIEMSILLASLLETMDSVANTASVYGAYLKHIKKSAAQPLVLRMPKILPSELEHQAYCDDANATIKKLAVSGKRGILYIDPPYNRRQYSSNYHILETIARWDLELFSPVGKTGLRVSEEQRSKYCLKSEVYKAFSDLIHSANFDHIIISYSNEGLLSEEELKEILLSRCSSGNYEFKKIPYKRFKADVDENRLYSADEVEEFLFYIKADPIEVCDSQLKPAVAS